MSARLSIIGGYLGSGKSTLVNRLLGDVLPGRTAVVVNDFGSVNIDADLIRSIDEDTIELTNGCICCQLTDDVARTMSALAAREDLDHVLCEVSGVGDPSELARWRDYPGFSRGVVATCADVTAIERLLRDPYVGDTALRQLRAAEVVMLTKLDLTSVDEVDAAAGVCAREAPQALLVYQSPDDPSAAAALAFAPGRPAPASSARARRAEPSGPAEPAERAEHQRDYASTTLTATRPVASETVAHLLAQQAEALVRAKGTLQDEAGRWYEVQLSSGRVDVRARDLEAGGPAHPGLVLIASGRDPHAALSIAEAALARSLAG